MKLKAELQTVVTKFEENRDAIEAHAKRLRESERGYNDFETRLANDALRGLFGTSWICDLYEKYDCHDAHITTLAKKALKEAKIEG